jgi:hypothetical protein
MTASLVRQTIGFRRLPQRQTTKTDGLSHTPLNRIVTQ